MSVVLPCLDEAGSVAACVADAREALAGAGIAGEIIVVDNGSADGSAELARAAGARVVHEAHRGYGSALLAGFDAARGDIVVMADADRTYDLARIPALLAPIVAGEADLVLGSRLGGATRKTMPWLHRFVGTPALTFLTTRACGRRVVRDSQSGFRAFRRWAVADLDLQSTGMELATEMLIRATRAGLRIREVETGYGPREGDSKLSTFADGWRHLQLILLLAPDLLLVGPGAALFAVGSLLLGLSFLSPGGIEIGSLRWQPVFFSGIALILGLQGVLAGAILAHRSTVTAPPVHRRFAFIGRRDLPNHALAAGLLMVVGGLVLNLVLFVRWIGGDPTPSGPGLGLASLSQALIVVGGTLASFGLIGRCLAANGRVRPRHDRERGAGDRTATMPVGGRARDLSPTARS